jgi:hypothetical protein
MTLSLLLLNFRTSCQRSLGALANSRSQAEHGQVIDCQASHRGNEAPEGARFNLTLCTGVIV